VTEPDAVERTGSAWNVVALIATLALAAVVAVVAVTRSDDRPVSEPTPDASSPSPSPSPSTPGGLNGTGPYLVYELAGTVFGFDLASGETTSLGVIDGAPVSGRSEQPDAGTVIAFPTRTGDVYRVTRGGLGRVTTIVAEAGTGFDGSALSKDDKRLATAMVTKEHALVIVELETGRTTVLDRSRRGTYPAQPLVPVGWSVGGSLVYQVPFCVCDTIDDGLYVFDLAAERSTAVDAARTARFEDFVISPEGQAVTYGTGTDHRCRSGEPKPCTGPPYSLRSIAAGRRGSSVLRRSSDESFAPLTSSLDGGLLIVQRKDAAGKTSFDLFTAAGDPASGSILRGIPADSTVLALLLDDVVVVQTGGGELLAVRRGKSTSVAVPTDAGRAGLRYLGWLR